MNELDALELALRRIIELDLELERVKAELAHEKQWRIDAEQAARLMSLLYNSEQ